MIKKWSTSTQVIVLPRHNSGISPNLYTLTLSDRYRSIRLTMSRNWSPGPYPVSGGPPLGVLGHTRLSVALNWRWRRPAVITHVNRTRCRPGHGPGAGSAHWIPIRFTAERQGGMPRLNWVIICPLFMWVTDCRYNRSMTDSSINW